MDVTNKFKYGVPITEHLRLHLLYQLKAFFRKCGLPKEDEGAQYYIWLIRSDKPYINWLWDVSLSPSKAYEHYFTDGCVKSCLVHKDPEHRVCSYCSEESKRKLPRLPYECRWRIWAAMKQEQLKVYEEELIAKTWHPTRFMDYCLSMDE